MKGLYERSVARLRGAAFSPDKPDENPDTTAMALWFAASGEPRAVTRVGEPLPSLRGEQPATLEQLVGRRVGGEPLAYLIGRQEFMGLEFLTAPGALIPRRETELVGFAALELARSMADVRVPVRVLDLCTGSANLAVALAVHETRCRVWATDLEPAALAVAASNVAMHNVGTRVTLLQGNLFEALRGSESDAFDLIVCNPPYIPSHKAGNMPVEVGGFEPRAAFDGGDFGINVLVRLVSESPNHLVPGGWLCFELGAGQSRGLEKRLASQGSYTEIRAVPDHDGIARALLARRAQ